MQTTEAFTLQNWMKDFDKQRNSLLSSSKMGAITLIVILLHLASGTEVLPTNDSVYVEEGTSELFPDSLQTCGKLCLCNATYASCSGHYDNLTYIPKLNHSIIMLNFACNSLENISKSTFENISMLNLKALWLWNNRIKHVAENSLQYFVDIEILDLAHNSISHSDLKLFLHGLNQSSLKYLNLGYLHLHETDQYSLHGIHNVQGLILSDNLITNVDFYDWTELNYLVSLDLSYNQISTFQNASLLNLTYLKLRANNLQIFPDLCTGKSKSTLRILDLSHNNINSVKHNDVKCLTSLKNFLLISINMKQMYDNTFSSLQNLVTLNLNSAIHYQKSSLAVEGYAFNNSALRNLSLNSLHNIQFKTAVCSNALRGCTNMEYISISHNDFESADDKYLTNLFGEMRLLKYLIMKDCRLHSFPVVVSKRLTNIVELNLHFNNIQTIKSDYFQNLKHLKRLNLRHNGIVVLDSKLFSLSLRHQLTYIDLADNAFSCTCSTLWLIEWMKMDSKKFMGFPKYYKCGYPLNLKSSLMINAPLSDIICSSSKMFPSIISITAVTIIVLAIVSLVYRWRWHIRHYIYVLRYQRRRHLPNEDVNFTYDAFVLFCDDDLVWVRASLMPKLEDEGGKRLCVHNRDFTPGKYIVDNIIESLENSRKVILILSNTFSESSWCEFELTLVQKRALEMQGGYLLVILLENIEARHMTSSLYALLQTTTYITWPEEEQDHNLFWERVRTSLEQ